MGQNLNIKVHYHYLNATFHLPTDTYGQTAGALDPEGFSRHASLELLGNSTHYLGSHAFIALDYVRGGGSGRRDGMLAGLGIGLQVRCIHLTTVLSWYPPCG